MVAATFPVFLSGVDLYKNSFSSLLTMDKLQLMGLNPGRVFNSRSDWKFVMHFFCSEAKQPNLKMKTRPKQLLGSLPSFRAPRIDAITTMLHNFFSWWRTKGPKRLECLSLAGLSSLAECLRVRPGVLRCSLWGRLRALPTDIRLGWWDLQWNNICTLSHTNSPERWDQAVKACQGQIL